jgi:hypothetical protein
MQSTIEQSESDMQPNVLVLWTSNQMQIGHSPVDFQVQAQQCLNAISPKWSRKVWCNDISKYQYYFHNQG